jgi:hypothetical protein
MIRINMKKSQTHKYNEFDFFCYAIDIISSPGLSS